MPTPASQAAADKPIILGLLVDGALETHFNLPIRPEEGSITYPTRSSAQQTFGSAWGDVWGLGINAVSLQGHTGWRGTTDADGAELWRRIRDDIWTRWHTLRAERQARGSDPDAAVEMLYLDTLNDASYIVMPVGQLVLRRNRARPLLYMYGMQLLKLRDAEKAVLPPLGTLLEVDNPSLPSAQVKESALKALQRTIDGRATLAEKIRNTFAPANRVIADLADGSAAVLAQVQSAVSAGIDAFDATSAPLVAASQQIELASRNLSQSLVEPLALTETAKRTLRGLYGSFSEAYCLLSNAFQPVGQYLDFSSLFGASNCSSTTGGRPATPWVGQNPFLALYEPKAASVSVTGDMQSAINEASQDVLSLAGQPGDYLLGLVDRIARGLPQ